MNVSDVLRWVILIILIIFLGMYFVIIVFVEEDFILGVREFILLVLNSEVVIREMDEEY